MNDANEHSDSKTGIVIAVVLLVLLLPCVLVVLVGVGGVFLFRASAVPQPAAPPAVEVVPLEPEIAPAAPVEAAQPVSPP